MAYFGERREKNYRIIDLVRQREVQDSISHLISQKLHVTENLIARLGLEKELSGHTGCVNCLEWNETGQILASASDDVNIILWDPFHYEKKLLIHSGHRGNIFSVKFMPKSNDSILVSGAGDCRVRVHGLALTDPILVCDCHSGRIKRIATAPGTPYVFWTAAEDGLICQYDIRIPHKCKNGNSQNLLINLANHVGRWVEAKCISINPKRPELLAVGCNDPYIRMYDRRMIKISQVPKAYTTFPELSHPGNLSSWERSRRLQHAGEGDPDINVPLGCAQYFIPGHLRGRQQNTNKNLTTTYLTFSSDGNELLVNMGGEQIYLFDVKDPKNSKQLLTNRTKEQNPGTTVQDNDDKKCFVKRNGNIVCNIQILPPHVEELKRQANEAFEQEKYILAINYYNKAISLCANSAVLYANRAASLMKRAWYGDTYAALRDCEMTLILDPDHVKAHFRLARCLYKLNRSIEAGKILEEFENKFPQYSLGTSCRGLKMDIEEAIDSGRDDYPTDQSTFKISEFEEEWRNNTIDYKIRFYGHCNTTTDIKETNFFGNNGQYIVAGSDDGSFFIWDRKTTNIVRILRGDDRIVNCLQPHPSICLLATSGIDHVIRLWSPLPEDGNVNNREIQDVDDAASANQIRMIADPFELMLMDIEYRLPMQHPDSNEEDDSQSNAPTVHPLNCRPS